MTEWHADNTGRPRPEPVLSSSRSPESAWTSRRAHDGSHRSCVTGLGQRLELGQVRRPRPSEKTAFPRTRHVPVRRCALNERGSADRARWSPAGIVVRCCLSVRPPTAHWGAQVGRRGTQAAAFLCARYSTVRACTPHDYPASRASRAAVIIAPIANIDAHDRSILFGEEQSVGDRRPSRSPSMRSTPPSRFTGRHA